MDKNSVRGYAIWARKELISRVTQKALQYGITKEEVDPIDADSVSGRLLTATEKKQRIELIKKIERNGFNQVIEEVAYTWFNRFTALRFMEVNGYLPSYVRVFTDQNNAFKPQILDEALSLNIVGLDMAKVYAYKESSETDELYKYLLITQCNALNEVLPRMFQQISDYTELLFPDNLLREGSIINRMVTSIKEEDWKESVEIIGWLYQYYNTEPKDEVFANLKKNKKITKENIPAATQLFTPDWIVRYMVENSLGRLWLEGHPDKELRKSWKYYLDEAEQEPDVEEQLIDIRKKYQNMKPEDIKCIDPCMGSGHILTYMFDVLMQIYQRNGYNTRDAVASIIENNLYGLDIDERASQLAYFSVMMKARQYDRRFFTRLLQPNVLSIVESNGFDKEIIDYFCGEDLELRKSVRSVIEQMNDAKIYGSTIEIKNVDFDILNSRFDDLLLTDNIYHYQIFQVLQPMVKVAELLSRKYNIVITNPPYMGSRQMDAKLSLYLKTTFKDSYRDLFSVFIERCIAMVKNNFFISMITQHSFMFLSSYEKLRKKMMLDNLINMAHLGTRAFDEISGEVVQASAFVLRRRSVSNYSAKYSKLVDGIDERNKEYLFLSKEHNYITNQEKYQHIPGWPIAYWASEGVLRAFQEGELLDNILDVRQGLATTDNNHFLRLWYELDTNACKYDSVSAEDLLMSKKKWVPYNKGGQRRQWYGNYDYMVNWWNDGEEIKSSVLSKYPYLKTPDFVVKNQDYYFRDAITWGLITSGGFSIRYRTCGGIHDVSGMSAFTYDESVLKYILGLMGTKISDFVFNMLNPTLNLQVGDFKSFPVLDAGEDNKKVVIELTDNSIELSKADWDMYETSWDFIRNPMIPAHSNVKLESIYLSYKSETNARFEELKSKEEELNRIFIQAYELESDLSPELSDRNITITKIFDYKEDIYEEIKNNIFVRTKRDIIIDLLSYAVGCMFGRYSLDEDGLVYAGGDWDSSRYISFPADKDNIIPICDDEYFEDDIVGKFVKFIEVAYGKETLEENLSFIADALEGKGSSREVIRNYFINHFYSDHCKKYSARGSGKRPIYWQFDSGKQNGFKCLIYMHRYKEDTIARIRTDYVHEQQARYRTSIEDLERQISHASKSERVSLTRRLQKIQSQAKEVHKYEEKIHHLADQMIKIDLDDGVKHNYKLFKDVLAKI